jgi:hypothetical protein
MLAANTKADLLDLHALLTTLLTNVMEHPSDAKYRLIKLNNKAIQSRLVGRKGGVEFLQAAGFVTKTVDGIKVLVLDVDDSGAASVHARVAAEAEDALAWLQTQVAACVQMAEARQARGAADTCAECIVQVMHPPPPLLAPTVALTRPSPPTPTLCSCASPPAPPPWAASPAPTTPATSCPSRAASTTRTAPMPCASARGTAPRCVLSLPCHALLLLLHLFLTHCHTLSRSSRPVALLIPPEYNHTQTSLAGADLSKTLDELGLGPRVTLVVDTLSEADRVTSVCQVQNHAGTTHHPPEQSGTPSPAIFTRCH